MKRVLLVGRIADGEEVRALQEAGYVLDRADTLEDALAQIASGQYARVVVDPTLLEVHGGAVLADTRRVFPDGALQGEEAVGDEAPSDVPPGGGFVIEMGREPAADSSRWQKLPGFLLHRPTWPKWAGYAASVLLLAALTDLLVVLQPEFPIAQYSIPYILLIMAVAYLFGEGPAVLTFVLSLFSFVYFFVPLLHGFGPPAGGSAWAMIVAYLLGSAAAGLGMSLIRRATIRIENWAERAASDRARLEALLMHLPAGVIIAEAPSGKLIMGNEQMERIWRRPFLACDSIAGYSEYAGYHSDGRPYEPEEWPLARSIRHGEVVTGEEIDFLRGDGTVGRMSVASAPIRDPKGRITAAVTVFQDITARKLAEQQIAQAREDAERRAGEMRSIVSSMMDGVALFDADGNLVMINEGARDILGSVPDRSARKRDSRFRTFELDGRPVPPKETAVARALRGERLKGVRQRVITPEGKELVLDISASPVCGREGRVLGAVTVFRDATEMAEVERRREELYQREHHIAQVLQEALIPRSCFEITGLSIAVKYQPAHREAEVGGDFYDAFDLGGGLAGVLIGDVAGKGLAAAMRVAAARHTIRSCARLERSPAAVMALANESLCKECENGEGLLTAFFAVMDTRNRVLVCSNAGHEPPVVRDRNGQVAELQCFGLALGVSEGVQYSEVSRILEPGEMIVLLTDGVVEARSSTGDFFGKESVIAYLQEHPDASPEEVAAGLLEAAINHSGGKLLDDAAILALML